MNGRDCNEGREEWGWNKKKKKDRENGGWKKEDGYKWNSKGGDWNVWVEGREEGRYDSNKGL